MFSPNNPFGLSLSKPSTEPVEVASPSAGRILRLHPERMIFGLALAALAASPAMAGKKRDAERQFYAPSVVAAPAAPAANGSIFPASMGYTPIGRAHVCTPVTNSHLVCRLLLAKKPSHAHI